MASRGLNQVSVYRSSRGDVYLVRPYSSPSARGGAGVLARWLRRKAYVVLLVTGVAGGGFLYVSGRALIRVAVSIMTLTN